MDAPPPSTTRPARTDRSSSRSDLLAIARALFADHGYAGVSMADIASKAGLKKSSLFHHFPTKDGLYRDVLDQVLGEIGGTVYAAIGAADRGFLERLDSASAAVARSLGEDATRARLIMRELLNHDGAAAHVDMIVDVIAATAKFFEDGAAAGAWPHQDFHQAVLTIAGVHCFYFAVPDVTTRVSGLDPFHTDAVERRIQAVQVQVRQLLGLASPPRG
jgi:AcrR family transcriptional regulator